VADVFDALTAERSYKPKMTSFEAATLMKEQMLPHFTPWLFERFVRLLA
jgi:HD-GYP domain-containing protein (c-di-GMP phosphodiesterase class II)